MYRMSILALTSEAELDVSKRVRFLLSQSQHIDFLAHRCVMLAIVHDLAEAQGNFRLSAIQIIFC
jgi:hypothetical protein